MYCKEISELRKIHDDNFFDYYNLKKMEKDTEILLSLFYENIFK